jgi:hypothetical protein
MQQQNDDTVHAAAIVLAAAARSTSTGLQRHLQQLDDHDHDHANCVTEVSSTCGFLSEFLMHQSSSANHIKYCFLIQQASSIAELIHGVF